MRVFYKKFLGVILILLGLVIILTPFTPGSIILLIGIDMVFGERWAWWVRMKKKIKKYLAEGKEVDS
ncbi:MAG: hypothetical protein WED06_01465 [Candidatus Paceibacterota bacterium]